MSSCFHFYNHILILLLFINQARTLCSSRKYPYPPPHGRDFSYDPPSPLDFPKWAHKMGPPPLWKFHFFRTPPRNIVVPCGNQIISYFLAQNTEFWSLPFFSETFGGYCDQHITRRYVAYLKDAYRRICNMKIIDFMPSIPLHNFDKTAVT